MKKMKKMMCLMLALVLAMGMSLTVLAGDGTGDADTAPAKTYTIKAPTTDDGVTHTYEIYQIFTGDLFEETEEKVTTKTLSNIKWGKNGTGTKGTDVPDTVLTALEGVANKSDTEKLAVIETYANLTNPYGTIESNKELENVPAGYYLIKDRNDSLKDKLDTAYTFYIVQVVGDVNMEAKSDIPTVDKEVATDVTDGWAETADHAINEQFQFKLTATVPAGDNIKAYDKYELVFNDTMSAGVTFDGIVSVQANGVDIAKDAYAVNGVKEGEAGKTWSLTINNLKDVVGNDFGTRAIEVVVIYNAYLNENAIVHNANAGFDDEGNEIGAETNNNMVELEYSNNPNSDGKGKTKPDHVWVFSFKVDNKKVDGDGKALTGAGFRLYTNEACTQEVALKKVTVNGEIFYSPVSSGETGVEMFSDGEEGKDATFNIRGLEAGTYYLKETTTPEGYNTCDVLTIEIAATHSENGTDSGAVLTLTKSENVNNTIENKKGSLLPETGGIGTTIFYVLGGILVLGCGVILIAKKRVSSEG